MMTSAYPQNQTWNPYIYSPAVAPMYQNPAPSAPLAQPQMPQQQQQASGGIDGIAFVQGENAALAYVVPAGKTFLLMDTVEDRIYFKSADAYGRPNPLNSFWLTKEKPEHPASAAAPAENTAPEYATKQDIEDLRAQIAELKAKKAPKAKRAETEETEGEE